MEMSGRIKVFSSHNNFLDIYLFLFFKNSLNQWFSPFLSLQTGNISKKYGGPVIFLMSKKNCNKRMQEKEKKNFLLKQK